jgi:hypothetical protein
MHRGGEIDPLGRQTVLAIAAGRIAIGVGALFATGPALRALGFAETDAAGRALARRAGPDLVGSPPGAPPPSPAPGPGAGSAPKTL